jgi:hypothetical protein
VIASPACPPTAVEAAASVDSSAEARRAAAASRRASEPVRGGLVVETIETLLPHLPGLMRPFVLGSGPSLGIPTADHARTRYQRLPHDLALSGL